MKKGRNNRQPMGVLTSRGTAGVMPIIANPRSWVFISILLKVDEEGAEAAAETAILEADDCAIMGPPPVPVIFDHPSIVAITDKHGAPLFLGHVSNPEET